MNRQANENGGERVVVITGASAGVGRATAVAFARRGARIGLIARGREGLEGALRDVEEAGGKGILSLADVSHPDEVEAAAETVEREFGPIGLWINNAMVTALSPVWDLTPEEYRRVTEVTYLGTVYGTMTALRRMRPRNRGTIIQVGSALAYRAIPLQSAYCGAKHAIRAFTDSLRTELMHEKSRIRVGMVQLPGLNTPQFDWCLNKLPGHPRPVPPIYQPEVAAEAIAWLAEHPRRELRVGLSTVKTVMAQKFAAGAVDHYLAVTGFDSQQSDDVPEPAGRRNNLFEPLPGDRGAHGSFDGDARPESRQLWAATHRGEILSAGAGMAAVALALGRKLRKER